MKCVLCAKPGTRHWPSIDWVAYAEGEDPESSIALCELCSFLAGQVSVLASHYKRMNKFSGLSVSEIGHLYGCLIDARHEDLSSYHHDPQARKLICMMQCEAHNRVIRFSVA